MINNSDIAEILNLAVQAPSGDNSQPWKFSFNEKAQKLTILVDPEKDKPLINIKNHGQFVALGAVVENIMIICKRKGIGCQLEVLARDGSDEAAIISFGLGESEQSSDANLFDSIRSRHTNRKDFSKKEISKDDLASLNIAGSSYSEKTRPLLFSDRESRVAIANTASLAERLGLEDEKLHAMFFGSLLWDPEDAKRGEEGLFIKTLELPKPIEFLFRKLRSWKLAKFLNRVGFSRVASSGNAKKYSASPVLGCFVFSDRSRSNYLLMGRKMQRLWLEADRLGVSFHMMTGTPFMAEIFLSGESHPYSKVHRDMVVDSYLGLKNSLGIDEGKDITLFFRLGYADSPSSASYRKLPQIEYI